VRQHPSLGQENAKRIFILTALHKLLCCEGKRCDLMNKESNDEIAFKEDDILPYEKWLAAFRNGSSSKILEEHDIVVSFAEKSQVEILWFLEKRECGHPYVNSNYPELESLCTYCNGFFSYRDSIPCPYSQCSSIFCSKICLQDHIALKHK
jgi:hypothetical protein